MWEQETEPFLSRPELLPYAALTRNDDRAATLRQVAQRIEELEDPQEQSNLSAAGGILAALSLDKELIKRILRRNLMQQSPLYLEWQMEAELRGRQEERRSLALKMLQENYPLEAIARLTEMSIEQLQQLQTNPQS